MPTYEYTAYCCDQDWEACVPMDERDRQHCPVCDDDHSVIRHIAAPAVMNVAMADGTRRFDKVRQYRELEKANRYEKDKAQKESLKKQMNKLTGKE